MIPWDDDLDIAIEEKHRFTLRMAMQRFSNSLHVSEIMGFDKIIL